MKWNCYWDRQDRETVDNECLFYYRVLFGDVCFDLRHGLNRHWSDARLGNREYWNEK